MNDMVVDSSVVAKWILPEADSSKAQQLISDAGSRGERLTLLDLAFAEVSNAIWKRHHRGLATIEDARKFLEALLRMPVSAEPAFPLLDPALEIAMKYHRPVYDTLFVALTEKLGSSGVTADEPLYNAVKADYAQIILLRNM